jgi:hypothetical protein
VLLNIYNQKRQRMEEEAEGGCPNKKSDDKGVTCQWLMPVIRRQRSRGSQLEASLGKYFLRSYLGEGSGGRAITNIKGLVEWLKQ